MNEEVDTLLKGFEIIPILEELCSLIRPEEKYVIPAAVMFGNFSCGKSSVIDSLI